LKFRLLFIALVAGLCLVTVPFAEYMRQRPVALKLGYTPRAEILKITSGEHRFLVAEINVFKVMFYFGSLLEEYANRNLTPPEYALMFDTLFQSLKLDPYNQDIYYFSQANFTWDVGRASEVNRLLEYGMKYRKNDFNLPFWAGFNSAYFLKNYEEAAAYMAKAAEISGDKLFTNLAARFFHEAGRTDLGIVFLDAMQKTTGNKAVLETYRDRKKTLESLKTLQQNVEAFQKEFGRLPAKLDELVLTGLIDQLPDDPYGGEFYLDPSGRVQTTSGMTYVHKAHAPHESDRTNLDNDTVDPN